MNICGDASKKEANYIVVPKGDLSYAEIALLPKSPAEKVFYEILFYKRLEDNDSIVSMTYNLGDTSLTLEHLEMFGKSFRFLLGGGTLGNKDIVQFTLTTKNGEERQLNVTVVIAPAGIAQAPFGKDYVIGDKGERGDKGDTGATGATGSAGPKGDKGDVGAAGTSAAISVGTTITGDAGSRASVTNTGTTSAAVFDFTIPQGAKGDTGAAGAKGDTGAAATITAGKTTTADAGTQASVTNSGTANAAIFDFTIPKGEKGDAGAKGDTGAAGASYTNDGTADLNVKTISSDGAKVKTDGNGILTASGIVVPGTGTEVTFTADSSGRFSLKTDSNLNYYLAVSDTNNVVWSYNNVTNTVNSLAYSLIDHSGITTTSLTAGVLAYNKTTNMPTVWNGTAWVDLTAASVKKTIPYIDSDKRSNVDVRTLEEGTQSWDDKNKKPCWWSGTSWVDVMGNGIA